jgi:GTPase binding
LLSYQNREFLVGQAPQLVKATSTYCVEERLKIEQNDTIAIIDGRPELSFLKGQNQRTFEIGTFPRNILEVLRFNRHGTLNTISRPVQGSFQHAAHGAAFGPSWGSPAFLDSSYNGKVQMRQKSNDNMSKSHRQQKTVSEHYAKEKKTTANKQFSYNKLSNDQRMQYEYQQQSLNVRPKPARPPAPSVQQPLIEGILIDLSPEEIRSMNLSLQSQASMAKPATTCLLDEPIDVPTEANEFLLQEQQEQQSFPLPPPYPMPPQYLNTNLINDPFDTTHLDNFGATSNIYSGSSLQRMPEPIYNNNPSRYSSTSNPVNEILSVSMMSLSLAQGNENINGQPVTPKKVEKQMLSEHLIGSKESTQVKLNLDQLMSMQQVPTTRSFDPFSPIQPDKTFMNNNYSSTYANQSGNNALMHYDSNIYNSVAGDSVYGENFYDAVQSQTPSVIYDSTASVYSVQQQQAIYDEVSAYDELRWQPQVAALRPAPAPPTQSPLLSQQQINRRLEKINQQQSYTAELMNKLSLDCMTEDEANEALEASNWNPDLATRHFKIERLSK